MRILFISGLTSASDAFSSANVVIEKKEVLTSKVLAMETNFIDILKEWQTLLAGILALSGALLTIGKMHYNHKDLIHRRNLAAKAYMHDALSEMCGYCQNMFNCFWDDTFSEEPEKEFFEKPQDAMKSLKDNIGYTDTEISESISNLLSCYQVFHSRLSHGIYTRVDSDKALRMRSERITEILEIYTLTVFLFSYARGEKYTVVKKNKVPRAEIERSLGTLQGNLRGLGVAYESSEPPYSNVMTVINERFE